MNCAPYDMIQFFDTYADAGLEIIEVAGEDGEWISVQPFYPDATLIVVLWQKGVHQIAVRLGERVANFDVYKTLLRDGSPIGVDRGGES
jgi:hypothetical protein